jgi:nitrite reductase/ring-hydroxylating ferredoxin subunit
MMPKLCDATEVTESGREFRVSTGQGAWFLMVFRRGGTIVAYRNVCPHRFLSLSWAPDRFMIGDDGLLVCPHHGAAFDLASGLCVQGPCEGDRLVPVAVRVADGELWLDPAED